LSDECLGTLKLLAGERVQELVIRPIPEGFEYDYDHHHETFRSAFTITHLLPGSYRIGLENGLITDLFETKANETKNVLLDVLKDSSAKNRLEISPSALFVSAWSDVESGRTALGHVNVTVQSPTGSTAATCSTERNGRCSVMHLQPGEYTLTSTLD